MSLVIPNQDRITKDDVKIGEAIAKVQQYVNQNVSPVAGNRLPAPPIDATKPQG